MGEGHTWCRANILLDIHRGLALLVAHKHYIRAIGKSFCVVSLALVPVSCIEHLPNTQHVDFNEIHS